MSIQLQHIRGAIVDPNTGTPTALFFDFLNQLSTTVVTSEDVSDSDLLEIGIDTSAPAVDPQDVALDYALAPSGESLAVDLAEYLALSPTAEASEASFDYLWSGQDAIVDNIRQDLAGFPVSLKNVNQGLSTTDSVSFATIEATTGALLANASATEQGAIAAGERSSDPSDPPEGEYVIWMSDGTGSGDDGDIMIKITAGAVTKTGTLVDFSTL